MDMSIFITMIGSWITYLFPSMAEYTKFASSAFMLFITVTGIFTNLLPEPGTKYTVPNVTELEVELQGGGSFILKIAKFTRSLIITVNWFIATAVYSWFYNFTNKIANFLPRFKKKTVSTK